MCMTWKEISRAVRPNKAQQRAIKTLFERSCDGSPSYLQFRRRFTYSHLLNCMFATWCGIMVGIESDGYTHS